MNIHNAIRGSIKEQDRQEALVAFHRGWDDGISEDTVLQGLMARYKACGKQGVVEHGLRIEREDLSTINVYAGEPLLRESGERRLVQIKALSEDGLKGADYLSMGYKVFDDCAIWVAHPKLWNNVELEEVSSWLMENHHH